MVATWNWAQFNGASAGTATDLGASGNLFNFKANDSATAADYSTNQITAGANSMEVWLKAHFTGTFNKVENLQFWMSTDFSPNTGLALKYKANGQTTGVTPVATTSSVATTAMPTADPATANVTIGGSLSGSLTAAGYSDYIVMQLQTTVSAAAGDTSLCTFTLQYDES